MKNTGVHANCNENLHFILKRFYNFVSVNLLHKVFDRFNLYTKQFILIYYKHAVEHEIRCTHFRFKKKNILLGIVPETNYIQGA
jgi:hypothetical protein